MLTKKYINENYYSDESFEFNNHYKSFKRRKHSKKKGNKCYCLGMLKDLGPLNIIKLQDSPKILINKMELVQFNDHFDDLFEKGKIIKNTQLKDDNKQSIPNLTFWYQRYYYYSKYDEGIIMDNESN
jgi:hypothetical protein